MMSMPQTLIDHRVEIQKISDLPPLPVIANKLMAKINNSEADIDDIAGIIIQDPGLTAKLLSLANSAFFSFGRNVNTVSEAIINVLGLELVKSLSIGLILNGTFDVKKCKHFNLGQYWVCALLTAELLQRLSKIKSVDPKVNPNFYYLHGLLHNIGMLIMADCFPEETDHILMNKEEFPEQKLVDIENHYLGIDHHCAAIYLANKWNLPEDIIVVMSQYFEPAYQGDHWQASQLCGFCSRLVHSWLGNSEYIETEDINPITLFGFPADKFEKTIDIVQNKLDDAMLFAQQMSH